MSFHLPSFTPPDFSQPQLKSAPYVTFKKTVKDDVLPEGYHATSVFPEYLHLQGEGWKILPDSRMDCAVVLNADGSLLVKEARNIKSGESVACGRGENGEDGIFVHTDGFGNPEESSEKFAFRSMPTWESPFSIDYDKLYDLLRHERQRGFILWVLGPSVVFDRDSRNALISLIKACYVHGVMAGNGFAVHDLEGAMFGTALGQDIYTKEQTQEGHYHHLDIINRINQIGSIKEAVKSGIIKEGVMHSLVEKEIPFVLAASIRDDGPLPDVEKNVAIAQDKMRNLARNATTVIALATQLHAIATGNMVPSYRVNEEGDVRPVYFYTVDMSEFVVNKLVNRGSLTARSFLTNAQDFLVLLKSGMERL